MSESYYCLECHYENNAPMGKYLGITFEDSKMIIDLAAPITHALKFKTKEEAESFQDELNRLRKLSPYYLQSFELNYLKTEHMDMTGTV